MTDAGAARDAVTAALRSAQKATGELNTVGPSDPAFRVLYDVCESVGSLCVAVLAIIDGEG